MRNYSGEQLRAIDKAILIICEDVGGAEMSAPGLAERMGLPLALVAERLTRLCTTDEMERTSAHGERGRYRFKVNLTDPRRAQTYDDLMAIIGGGGANGAMEGLMHADVQPRTPRAPRKRQQTGVSLEELLDYVGTNPGRNTDEIADHFPSDRYVRQKLTRLKTLGRLRNTATRPARWYPEAAKDAGTEAPQERAPVEQAGVAAALGALEARLAQPAQRPPAITNLALKRNTLDSLTKLLDKSIGEVLQDIVRDLERVSV